MCAAYESRALHASWRIAAIDELGARVEVSD
jgi:hypothetical protein